jgi:two-component system sensor histidine kinase/response regulator
MQILVADDNPVNCLVLKKFLKRAGCEGRAKIVNNGFLAFEACTSHQFELVFMDVHMPVMDGITATTRIREMEKSAGRAPVPIIALTADVSPEVQAACTTSGVTSLCSKPVKLQVFTDYINQYVSGLGSQNDE